MAVTDRALSRPRPLLAVVGLGTLVGVAASIGYAMALGDSRAETVAAAVVLFASALSCFAFGVLSGVTTGRLAPMLLGYLPGLLAVLLTGLRVEGAPPTGTASPTAVVADLWILLNPLLWLPFAAVGLALRRWSTSHAAPSRAPTSGTARGPTRSRTAP